MDIADMYKEFAEGSKTKKDKCIYKEAIDALVSCLKCSDSPVTQIAASDTILALQGRFSSSGKPLVRTYLLKCAGFDKSYRPTMGKEQLAAISGDVQETMVCFNAQCLLRVSKLDGFKF
nr:putative E3 ubiquitin-protein ligase LIN [Tanacetum cinerariifolium]